MDTPNRSWKHLTRKPESLYRQLFVKDRWVAARTLYAAHTSQAQPMTPEELADLFEVPLEAVREAIAYGDTHPPEFRQDQEAEAQRIRELQAAALARTAVPSSSPVRTWKHLGPKRKSSYRQLFIKDRGVAARTIYGLYMSDTMPRSPEEIAADCDLPLEAVLEAIAYCDTDPPEIRQDWEDEERLIEKSPAAHESRNGQAAQHPSPVSPASS